MSAIPAVPEHDLRATTLRGPSEDSTHSAELKFQDAVDSRRAEHAHSAAKDADERSSRDRASECEEDSTERDAGQADDVAPSQRSASADSTQPTRAKPSAARAEQGEAGEPVAASEAATTHRTIHSSKSPIPAGTSAPAGPADSTALAIPWFGQAVLQVVLARALPHGAQPISGVAASGSAPLVASAGNAAARVGAQPSGVGDQAPAAIKAPNSVAIEADAIGPLLRAARDVEPSAQAVDPRGALGALVAPPTSDAAVAQAPAPERLTPAELPALFERLAVSIDTPERSALVQLDPAELGPLSISLSVEPGGHVRAQMHAQRPEGYAALEAQLPQLHASLIERGFTSASLNLSLGLADSHSRRSGGENEGWKSSSAGRRSLADAEVRALLPAAVGAIDMWA